MDIDEHCFTVVVAVVTLVVVVIGVIISFIRVVIKDLVMFLNVKHIMNIIDTSI